MNSESKEAAVVDMKRILAEVGADINSDRESFIDIASEIWNKPELAFSEITAAGLLTRKLSEGGFNVQCPYAGMETAFRAEFRHGDGGAVFALAAEYDALAGIGHACGHNVSGVASVAAALAVKSYLERHDLPGVVIVLGTPGEEGGGGKVRMLRDGNCLAGVDAVMMAHAGGRTMPDNGSTGIRRYDVIFHGLAAHAAGAPEKGINALDAQVLLFNAVGLYRQQMDSRGLIHGVIFEGGTAVNVIPDRTRSRFYLRSADEGVMEEIDDRFRKMVEGAALMTGTTFEINPFSTPYRPRRPNRVLNDMFIRAAETLGMRPYTGPSPARGSSDFGDFSQVAPGAHPYFGLSPEYENIPGHSEKMKACANSKFGYEQMLKTGACLAACAIAVLTDSEVREAVQADFRAAGN